MQNESETRGKRGEDSFVVSEQRAEVVIWNRWVAMGNKEMNTKGAELILVKCTLCVKHSAHHKIPLRLGFQMIEIETERE